MGLIGGRADKLGNYFELLWIIKCLTEILDGKYISINVEPLSEESEAFEFSLQGKNYNEFHQVKRQNSKGDWTLRRLESLNILSDFWDKLSTDESFKCTFVSMISAGKLHGLCKRATEITHSWAEFNDNVLIKKEWSEPFQDLKRIWGITNDNDVYEALTRINVVTLTENILKEMIEKNLKTLVTGNNIELARTTLQDYVQINLGKDIYAEDIWNYLKSQGFKRVNLPSSMQYGYKKYPILKRTDIFIPRDQHVKNIHRQFISNHVVLIQGIDGLGKTTLLNEFLREYRDNCFYFSIGKDITSSTSNFLFEMCDQMQHLAEAEYRDIRTAEYNELKDMFVRMCMSVAKRGRREGNPYFLVIDGLEFIDGDATDESIIDLLPHDVDGYLRILATSYSEIQYNFSYSKYPLAPFSELEVNNYLSRLSVPEHLIEKIKILSNGVPAYLSMVGKDLEQGVDIYTVASEIPQGFSQLVNFRWQSLVELNPLLLDMFSVIVFSKHKFNEISLGDILNIDENKILEIVSTNPFLSIRNKKIVFAMDAYHRVFENILDKNKSIAWNLLIDFYQENLDMQEAKQELPMILYMQEAKQEQSYEALQSLVDVNYLTSNLSIQNDLRLLRRDVNYLVEKSSNFEDWDRVAQYSLMSSVLKSYSMTAIGKIELEALLGIGMYDKALQFAYSAKLPEDRLQLFAVLGKYLQKYYPSKIAGLLEEIHLIIDQLDNIDDLSERIIDVAVDLFYVHPSTSIDLIHKVGVKSDNESVIDTLLAILTLRLENDSESTALADEAEFSTQTTNLRQQISDDHLRNFVSAKSQSFSQYTAHEVIEEVDELDDVSAQLFLLRAWCNANRENKDAIYVIQAALEIINNVSNDEYTPSMLHLRQFAEPLLSCTNNGTIDNAISTLDEVKSTIVPNPLEEAVRYELILAQVQRTVLYTDDAILRLNRIINLINEMKPDLDIFCYCLARLLLDAEKVDPDEQVIDQEMVKNELDVKLQELLDDSADHFEVTKRILPILARYDIDHAISLISKLNLAIRRDKAYERILRIYYSSNEIVNEDVIIRILDQIEDPELHDVAIVRLIQFYAEHTDKNFPVTGQIVTRIHSFFDPIDKVMAITWLISLSSKVNDFHAIESDFQELHDAWKSIDSSWERIHVGYTAVAILADSDIELAKKLFEIIQEERIQQPLSESLIAELYTNTLGLMVRSFSGICNYDDYDARLSVLIEDLIPRVPSRVHQVRLLADLALRLKLNLNEDKFNHLINNHISPKIESIPDDYSYSRTVVSIAACLYEADERFFEGDNRISRAPTIVQDMLIINIIRHLITKFPLADNVNFESDAIKFTQVHHLTKAQRLLSNIQIDGNFHYAVKLIVNALVVPSRNIQNAKEITNGFGPRNILKTVKQIHEIAVSKLPDENNIKHEGYLIGVEALLVRLKNTVRNKRSAQWDFLPSWENLEKRTLSLPNASDRVLVMTLLATAMASDPDNLDYAKSIINSAYNLVINEPHAIPNVGDRYQLRSTIAEAWKNIGDLVSAKLIIEETFAILDGLRWDETKDEVSGSLLELAHSFNPELAGSLAKLVENPITRNEIEENLQRKDLQKNPQIILSQNIEKHNDLAIVSKAALNIYEQMCSLGSHTIQDNHVGKWLNLLADAPFYENYCVQLMSLQNKIRKQTTKNLISIPFYNGLFESLKLVYLIGEQLYFGLIPDGDSVANSVAVPSNLKHTQVSSKTELINIIQPWLADAPTNDLLVYFPSFNDEDLLLFKPVVSVRTVTVITTWVGQEVDVSDKRTIKIRLSSMVDRILEDVPEELRFYIIGDQNGFYPEQNNYILLDKSRGIEIVFPDPILKQGHANIRVMSIDECAKVFAWMTETMIPNPKFGDGNSILVSNVTF